MDLDYFYNREAERFNFLKDPKDSLQYVALEITIHKWNLYIKIIDKL